MWISATALAATIERWWFPRAWDESALLASRFYFGDARAYLSYASALVHGETFDNGVPFHPVGWPLVLSAVFRAFGSADEPPDLLTLKHFAAILSGVSVGLTALLALVVSGRAAMVMVSFLGTFHFGHLVQAASPNSEPLYGLLMVGVLLCGVLLQTQSQLTTGPALAMGALAGMTTIVRAEFALCAALIVVWIAVGGRPSRKTVALFLLGFFMTLLPTTLLNWRSLDQFNRAREGRMPGPLPRFAPVTSYGAFNFANANHSAARGGFNVELPSLLPEDGTSMDRVEALGLSEAGLLDLSRPPVYRAYVDGYRIGTTWIIQHPIEALSLLRAKLSITLSMFDYGYLLDNVPVTVRGTRRPVDQIDLDASWLTVLHACLAVFGGLVACRRRQSLLIMAPIVTMLVSAAAFFGYVRLGVAYLPMIWILQAMALGWILHRVPVSKRVQQGALLVAAALGLALILSEAASSRKHRVLMLDGMVDETGNLVEDQVLSIDRVR